MNLKIFSLLTLLLVCVSLSAQRRGSKSFPAKPRKEAVTIEMIQNYIACYDFDKALQALAEYKGEAPALEQQAELGASMLQGIRRVEFLDSVVVDEAEFLSAIRLSEGSGRLALSGRLVSYTNDFGDVRIVCRTDSAERLVLTREDKTGPEWQTVARVDGEHDFDVQNYPYLMPDGQILYFAERGDESLGGYDIFVTRYDAESKQFLRPENIGMPFNSPDNDYMYVVDEQARLGWFVTDRRQPEGKVCVYIFRPSDSYETLAFAEEDAAAAIDAARIPAFTPDRSYLDGIGQTQGRPQLFIVIDDATVYTDLSQFRSATAGRIAREWLARSEELTQARQTLDDMRRRFRSAPELRERILEQEAAVHRLAASVRTLEKNMREAEIK